MSDLVTSDNQSDMRYTRDTGGCACLVVTIGQHPGDERPNGEG